MKRLGGEKMKNKKNMFTLAIVALILILGVGYAVVSATQLTINGSGEAETSVLKVVYDGVNTSSGAKVTTLTAADDSKAATFAVENMVLNTVEYAEFEIKNKESDVNATIKVPTAAQFTNSNSEYFETKIYYNDIEWTTDQTLNANATAKIKVTVKLIKTPVESANSSTTISVTYDAQPAA